MEEHDWKNYPELTNAEMEELELVSPHEQIKSDFVATVVKVHDGDTITLSCDFRDFNFPLRFLSVDAPELSEGVAGSDARDWLINEIQGKEVKVQINRFNRVEKYGRLLGDIMHAGVNISETMLLLGFCKPFERRNEGKMTDLNKYFSEKIWF